MNNEENWYWRDFHITLHAAPQALPSQGTLYFQERDWPSVTINAADLVVPFAISFEEACDNLGKLQRMYVEPDGSFVWRGTTSEQSWQIDGNLYDRQGRVLYCEMKGACFAEVFRQFLAALLLRGDGVVIQEMRSGNFFVPLVKKA